MVDGLCDPRAGAVRVDACGMVLIERAPLREAAEEIALRVLERAVLAAGGSAERVPLAKLESVVAAVRGLRVAAPGRWTLARALITAEPSALRVEREPGREPLPEIAVAPGTTAVWDGRFRVTVAAAFPGPVQVRAVGQAGLRNLRRRAPAADGAPDRAAAAGPSIWHEGRLVAVPPLRYWAPPFTGKDIGAAFVGIATSTRAPSPSEAG
jgi:tRNA(Ile)-lysidine synthase